MHRAHNNTTAPLYLRTLWRYTNAVIIIIIIIITNMQYETKTHKIHTEKQK